MTEQEGVYELGRGLPALLLRALVLITVVLACLLLLGQGVLPLIALVVGALGVLAVLAPASLAAGLFIGSDALITATLGDNPLRLAVLATVPVLHLMHVATGLAALVPLNARVHVAALLAPARRFGIVQVICLGAAGIAALLPTDRNAPVVEIAALLGVGALALLAVRFVDRVR